MPYPEDFLEVQWAREATPGTDLATTSKAIVTALNATPSSPPTYKPTLLRGLLLANRGGESVIQRGSDLNLEGPLTFEQAQHLFNGVLANVAAPTGAGPYIWQHTRNPAAMPTTCHFTIERRVTDKVTPIDHAWHYCTFRSLQLTFNTNEVWLYNADLFARRVQTETLTPAIALPAHEVAIVPGTKVFIDPSWATLGTTQIVGQILSGDVTINTGAAPLWTADGRADRDWGVVRWSSEEVTYELNLQMLVGANYASEKTAAEAATLRAVRLQIDGSDASRQIQLDMLMKHDVPELFEFPVQDGQFIVGMHLVGSTDGTNAIAAKVTNNVATFT